MSEDHKEQPVEYIFRAKTKEAFVIKILGELLANTIQFSPFKINEKGISLTQADQNTEILVDILLPKESFNGFKCTKPLSFMVNSSHFHKMLRNIKKKDTITMYITEDDPTKLGICIEKSDENNKTTTTIRITNLRPETFTLPDRYDNPIVMSVKEFQQIKALGGISRTTTVSSRPGYLRFFCDGGELWTRDVVHNEMNEEEASETTEMIVQNFHTHYLTGLTKCAGAGQQSNVQVYVHPELPLKIKMRAGNLGDLTIYIKSKEMIELEELQNEEEAGNEEAE